MLSASFNPFPFTPFIRLKFCLQFISPLYKLDKQAPAFRLEMETRCPPCVIITTTVTIDCNFGYPQETVTAGTRDGTAATIKTDCLSFCSSHSFLRVPRVLVLHCVFMCNCIRVSVTVNYNLLPSQRHHSSTTLPLCQSITLMNVICRFSSPYPSLPLSTKQTLYKDSLKIKNRKCDLQAEW